jgi:hypothetical protein
MIWAIPIPTRTFVTLARAGTLFDVRRDAFGYVYGSFRQRSKKTEPVGSPLVRFSGHPGTLAPPIFSAKAS